MADSRIRIHIGSEADLGGFGKLKSALASAASKVKAFAAKVGSNLMNIKAGFDMLRGAVQGLGGLLKKALDAETMTVQFKTLLGSMDEAKEHMAMLKDMGSTPPFSMEEFAAASRAMMTLSDGALGMRGSLELVGDAAAATGKPLEQVGEAVAKAYAMIRDGQPVSRAANELRGMGLITPEVAAQLTELQKAGADNAEIWASLERALGKYSGAMAETEETGNGMIGAIQSQWDETIRDFGQALWECGAEYIKEFLDWLRKIREDGSLQAFTDKFAAFVKFVIRGLEKAASAFKSFRDQLTEWFSIVGDVVGAMAGGASFQEAVDWAGEQVVRREKERKWDEETEAEEKAARIKEAAAKKEAAEEKKKAEAAKRTEELKAKAAEQRMKAAEQRTKKAAEQRLKEALAANKKLYEQEQKFAEQLREEAKKKAAQTEKDLVEKNGKAQTDKIDKQIKALETRQKKFEETTKKGIEQEKKHSWDGKSSIQLDEKGLPGSVADADRAARFAARAEREKAHRERNDVSREYFLRRSLRRGLKLTDSDRRFLQKRADLRERRAAEERLKQLKEKRDQAVVDMKKTLDKIEKNLKDALTAK